MNHQRTIASEGDNDCYGSLLKASMEMITKYYRLNPKLEATGAEDIGSQLGEELAGTLIPLEGSLSPAIEKFSAYWVKNGFGETGWEKEKRGNYLIRISCHPEALIQGRGCGATSCSFLKGLLEGFLSRAVGGKQHVEEVECGSGVRSCIFRIGLHSIHAPRPSEY